jgi:TonB family protein
MRIPLIVLAAAALVSPLSAQSRAGALIDAARVHLLANRLDSADVLLRAALDSATQRSDSVNAFIWRGILAFLRGDESGTSTAFHQALAADATANVQGLGQMSPRLEQLFEEQRVALSNEVVYPSGNVDEKPRRTAGPAIRYPPDLLRRQVRGRALIGLTVDTLGHAVPASIDILSTPDSGFVEPLRQMLPASTFSPGRIRGRAVRTMIELAVDLVPGTPSSATELVTAARAQLAAHHGDSALALLRDALDPATKPTAGERVYALLVRGTARSAAGSDSLARVDYDTALAGYQDLTTRGVELAPFLRRLADSLRVARHPRSRDASRSPVIVGVGNVAPVLLSSPPIQYPPEMQALRIGGTVTVEATIDSTGGVVPGSVRVVQSPNPGFDAEAMRVVTRSRYRPARRGGQVVSAVVRQAITFTSP